MNLDIIWPDSVKSPAEYKSFLQKQANRLAHGYIQYGAPKRSKLYFSRLKKELRAYERTHNVEHLINAANYCILESICPELGEIRFDNTVKSVTRKRDEIK